VFVGESISLEQLLDSRENRALRQREWLTNHSQPIISFTINMVGDVKVNTISKIAFNQGIEAMIEYCQRFEATFVQSQKFEASTGLEFMALVKNITALDLKKVMVEIEDTHPLGRLFDIDVIGTDAIALSRDAMMLPRRRCMVCNNDAKVCARSRAHTKEAIFSKMNALVDPFR